jgi:hypothetical protein
MAKGGHGVRSRPPNQASRAKLGAAPTEPCHGRHQRERASTSFDDLQLIITENIVRSYDSEAPVNALLGLAIADPLVNQALTEIAWTPEQAISDPPSGFGVLRVATTLWVDMPEAGEFPPISATSVWSEAVPVLSSIDMSAFPEIDPTGATEWLLMPNDATHQPNVMAYEILEADGESIALMPAYVNRETGWREQIADFRSASGIQRWFVQLQKWPWQRDCIDRIVGGSEPRWTCEDRGCVGSCVKVPKADTGNSIRLVCECSS